MTTTTDLLKKQIGDIPRLRSLASAEVPAFKAWKQVTISIIERRLGKKKADDFPSDFDFWPSRVGPWDPDELQESLLSGLDNADAYLNSLIIEIELLGEENSDTSAKLKFGDPGKQGRPGGGGSVFIQAEHFNITGGGKISADGGDNIVNNKVTHGDNSPIDINYGTINESTAEAIRSLTEIMRMIGESQLPDDQKRQLIGDAEIVKASIIQPTPYKTGLQKAWAGLQAASTIAGVIKLLQMIGTIVVPLLHI